LIKTQGDWVGNRYEDQCIVGSPCKSGNVDALVSEALKGTASHGAETRKIYLNDLKILK
jgi:multimeric flavodoxin WrbA